MHDIDRTQLETGWETGSAGEFGYENFETFPETYEGEFESSYGEFEEESPIGEADEMELAAELQEISSEEELDQFIGKVFNRVKNMVGKALPPGVRNSLGGMLKGLAKKYLPIAGAALGNMFVPGLGGMVGGKLASAAGRAFGLELEGLSPEDQEFEVNRRYVRTATEAAKQASAAPISAPPEAVAKQALTVAAQKHAPGLVAGTPPGAAASMVADHRRGRRSGRWLRRGRMIILFGA
jgi:hypothetical protein